jgi:hypothetical protein
MSFAYYCNTRSQGQHPLSQIKTASITQLTNKEKLLSPLTIHLWHLTKWKAWQYCKDNFQVLVATNITARRVFWHMIDSWNHAKPEESQLSSTTSPQYHLTILYHVLYQHVKRKNSRMNHKCPRLFINAVSNAEKNHKFCIAGGVNKTGPGYHFESCILLMKFCTKTQTWYENTNLSFSWHWPELASRTNNPLRWLVESWQF